MSRFLFEPGPFSATLRERIEEGARITGEEYARAPSIGHQCRAMIGEAMADCDVLIAPSATGEAPKGLENTGSPVLTQIWTFLSTPTVTVPVHKGPSGLPVSLRMCGRIGDDPRTLAAAHWNHRRRTP